MLRRILGPIVRRAERWLGGYDPRIRGDMALVRQGYRDTLQREIDPGAVVSWSRELRSGRLTVDEVLHKLERSPEALLNTSGFYTNLHRARVEWAQGLDAWETLLDIGGSSPSDPRGALIELGYSHRPREVHILDRPVDDQFHGRPEYDQADTVFDWGRVEYHHGLAEEITAMPALAQRRFDAIFMGQTIEHIEVDRLGAVLCHVRALLADGGRFVFDTPNRAVTRIVMGGLFLTDDHTYEYEPDEMAALLEEHGFRVVRRTGILPMPRSVETNDFDPAESEVQPWVVDDPSACFVFAFECEPAG